MSGFSVHEGGDDVPQGGEGEVDLGRLLEPVPRSPRLGLPLTPRQIHQVELTLQVTI